MASRTLHAHRPRDMPRRAWATTVAADRTMLGSVELVAASALETA